MTKAKQLKAAVLSTVVGVLSPLALVAPAGAADSEWVGNVSSQYGAFVNWSPQSVPRVDGDNAIFSASATNQNVVATTGGPYTLSKLIFNGDNPGTSSKSYTITGDIPFTLQEGIDAVMTGSGGDHAVELDDITLGDNVTFVTSGSNTLAVGGEDTTLDLNGNDLTLDASGGTITLQGEIDGAGNITLAGENKVNMMASAGSSFSPTVTVSDGEFIVSSTTVGDVVVDGGVLKGESDLLGDVTLNSGSIEPGNSPGCLGVDDLTLTGGTYTVELEGATVCTQYDSTAVTGDVTLGDGTTTLDIQRLSSFAPSVDDKFAIITYEDSSTLTGHFAGLEDGENVTLAEYTYEVNYDDSNAVTLTVLGTPSAPYTGVGSLLSSPAVTLGAALAVLASVGALHYAEAKRSRK